MNLFQIVIKQMRQRALGTWLTLLSVLLGVALATAVLVIQREGEKLFAQADFGYDVLVGPTRGSPLQLTLNSIYNLDVSPGLLDYKVYTDLQRNRAAVRLAIPIAKGDTFAGLPLIGTVPRMFNHTNDDGPEGPRPIVTEGPNTMAPFEYRLGRSFKLASGRVFHPRRFEALIGSDVPARGKLKIGDRFKAVHGAPKPGEEPDVHDQEWTVVGVLERTNTAADRSIYIPLVTFFAIGEHEEALETVSRLQQGADISRLGSPGGLRSNPIVPAPAPTTPTTPSTQSSASPSPAPPPSTPPPPTHSAYSMNGEDVVLNLPESEWKVSAIFVRSRSAPLGFQLMYALNNSGRASASNPATIMREFFNVFLRPSAQLLLAIAALVSVVAGIGILVAIYNSVSARMREIAILRALGATRQRILLIICLEAGIIGLVGAVLGVATGLVVVALGANFLPENLGNLQPFRLATAQWIDLLGWLKPVVPALVGRIWVPLELLYFMGVIALSVLGGLVPALKAYRVPVSTHLTA